jgi:multidrug efflux system membrane fusion protein
VALSVLRRPSWCHRCSRVAGLVAIGALALSAACSEATPKAPSTEGGGGAAASAAGGRRGRAGGEAGPVPVVTATAVSKPMPIAITAVGAAEAISTMQVRAQVSGRLAKVHFAEGQDVDAGQVLFTLDPQPFQVALDQANAILARDMAQAQNADAQVARLKNLLDRGLVPREQYDTQLATAAALKATTDADRADVAAAQLNLQYTTMSAPAAGRTGALQVQVGDLVQANGAAPLVVLNQTAPIYVTFSVPGKSLDGIRRFQRVSPLKVTARLTGVTDAAPATGRLTFVDNVVDGQTGTIRLKATFPNSDRNLWPGQFVDVSLLLTTEPKAVVVPSLAVQAGQQGPFVFIIDAQSQAEIRPVTVARIEGDESVIASGITPGEVVVTDGQLRLTPGVHVAPRGPARASAVGGSR